MRNQLYIKVSTFLISIMLFYPLYGRASSPQDRDEVEQAIGQCLALEGFRKVGLPVEDETVQQYINLVGLSIVREMPESGRRFSFMVLKSPLSASYALPGGVVLITSTLFKSLRSEAQLAGLLARDIAHIVHGHALRSLVTTTRGKNDLDFDSIVEHLRRLLFEGEYDTQYHYEADLSAMELVYRTGYNPKGVIDVVTLFDKKGAFAKRVARCKKKLEQYQDFSTMAENQQRFEEFKKKLIIHTSHASSASEYENLYNEVKTLFDMNKYAECLTECSSILAHHERGIRESGNYLLLSRFYEIKADCLERMNNIDGSVMQLTTMLALMQDKLSQETVARIKLKIGHIYTQGNKYSLALAAFKNVEKEYATLFPNRFARYARENIEEIDSQKVAVISGKIRYENGDACEGATIKLFNGFGESETISGSDGTYSLPLYFSTPRTYFSVFACKEGYTPAVVNVKFKGSAEVKMEELVFRELPDKPIGTVAGVVYTPIRGGKRVRHFGIKKYTHHGIEFQKIPNGKENKDIVSVSSNTDGIYRAFLSPGTYRLNDRGQERDFGIKEGECKIINIRAGKVMVD
ncbi:MAG: M48 family metalloprotease [bacterium]